MKQRTAGSKASNNGIRTFIVDNRKADMNRIIEEDIRRIIAEPVNWEKLRGKNILITGASGMLGRYIAYVLLDLNREQDMNLSVCGLIRNPDKLPDELRKAMTLIHQSVTDSIPEDNRFDYVIHAASPASPRIMREDPTGTIAANVLGTWNTLQAAHRSGADGYLFVSSREIYGQPEPGCEVFHEDNYGFIDPLDPRSCYPEGKRAAETMCACFHKQFGLNTKAARLAHTYGPGMSVDDGRVQADFFRDLIHNRNIVLKSEGTAVRTYTYVSDAAAALFYILLNGAEDEIAYNICTESAVVSIRQLAETMVSVFPDRNLSLEFNIPRKEEFDGTARFTKGTLSSGKLRKLGWEPKISLEEGIRRTVAFLESQD